MRTKSLAGVMLVAIACIGASAGLAATAPKLDAAEVDGTTALNVKLALLDRLGTDALHIDVKSVGGTARLSGTVDRQKAKDRAGSLAMSTRGVHRVENGIRLGAAAAGQADTAGAAGEGQVKDAVLETRLLLALIDEMGSDGLRIGADATGGVVSLAFDEGSNSDSRGRAVAIATRTAGVSKVLSVDKVPLQP
jgi:osmotically-inducible protein OsmY